MGKISVMCFDNSYFTGQWNDCKLGLKNFQLLFELFSFTVKLCLNELRAFQLPMALDVQESTFPALFSFWIRCFHSNLYQNGVTANAEFEFSVCFIRLTKIPLV